MDTFGNQFIQFVVVNVWFEKMQDVLSKYYVVFILFAWMGINVKLFNTDMGIVLIVGLLLGREKVWNRQENVLWLTTILVVDCILVVCKQKTVFINLIYIPQRYRNIDLFGKIYGGLMKT